MAVINGTSGNDSLVGTTGADSITGLGGDDTLLGSGGADTLLGGGGNDSLDGGNGSDSMVGGAGDDTYIVNAVTDVVVESAGQGLDVVRSSVTYRLPANVENLVLTGTANINGTGNGLANVLTGNAGNNRLVGGGGNDTLAGGEGDDTLDGGLGDDSMAGGLGNDTYVVNAAGDVVTELAGQGLDTVRSSISYALGANLENLVLTGTASISGTGNGLANAITGNAGANTLIGGGGNDTLIGGGGNDTLDGGSGNDSLDGGTGNDSMAGGAGDDIYVVNAAGDIVTELVAQGIDTVRSTIAYTLGANVEHLELLGSGNINGAGNGLANAITGNPGNNRLSGGVGNDTLDGGAGDDTLLGGSGTDWFIYDPADGRVDGGAGTDRLVVEGSGVSLSLTGLTAPSGGIISDVEEVDLTGAGNNILSLTLQDVADISSTTDLLRVLGNAGDRVKTLDGGWAFVQNVVLGPETYAEYTNGPATLHVDVDVNRAAIAQSARALSALDGTTGFRLEGEANADAAGVSVSSAGDVNGDGFDDVLIGAWNVNRPDADAPDAGATYVVFGKATGFAASIHPSTLDGSNGFIIYGATSLEQSGISVSEAGDVNGDGFGDLIVGAHHASPNGTYSGASYVVFGKAAAFDATLSVSTLDGTNGFRLEGTQAYAATGVSVSVAGDVNGDGFDDLVVGAVYASPNGTSSGAAYVVFGKASGFASSLNLSALNGTDGFQLQGISESDYAGRSVSAAGDVNGDGFDDLVIGARRADDSEGAAYVVFGQASGFASAINLSTLNGSNGFALLGPGGQSWTGWSVSAAGDINGDGYADIIVGSGFGNQAHVVFGKASGFAQSLNLSTLDGSNGFKLDGTNLEGFGDLVDCSVSGAGDVNGDGFDDLLIGAPRTGDYAGAGFVVFGKASGFASSIDLAALDGTSGFKLPGVAEDDYAGKSVSAAGDVNGDGFADLIVGATRVDTYETNAGAGYVIFGGDFTGSVTYPGTGAADTFVGTSAAENFVSGRGNDTLTGGGGADVFHAGAGNDLIRVPNGEFRLVDGGSGTDTLQLLGESRHLDLPNLPNSRITGVERIDITGSGDNTLTLSLGDLLDLSDSTNGLRVDGNAGDTLLVSDPGNWTQGSNIVIGSNTYHAYTLGTATLLYDIDITSNFPP